MWLVCLRANRHETFKWKYMYTISVFSVSQGSAGALIRWGGKIWHILIAYFLSNISAKYYENPIMLLRATAKTSGKFIWDTVYVCTNFNRLSFQKTRLNDFFVWYKNLNTSFFRFVTIYAFDRQRDGQTDRQTDRQNYHRYTDSAFHAAR